MVEWTMVKDVEGEAVRWEKAGQELMGKFIEARTGVGKNKTILYFFEVEPGKNAAVWGTALLDSRLVQLRKGQLVRIVFKGKETSKKTGRTYQNFEVFTGSDQIADI
jgi:hypothetical protein